MESRVPTNWGLFELLVMFFGLTNGLAMFQTMMNNIFADLIGEGVVCFYMDDIFVFMETREKNQSGHLDHPGMAPETQTVSQGGGVQV